MLFWDSCPPCQGQLSGLSWIQRSEGQYRLPRNPTAYQQVWYSARPAEAGELALPNLRWAEISTGGLPHLKSHACGSESEGEAFDPSVH